MCERERNTAATHSESSGAATFAASANAATAEAFATLVSASADGASGDAVDAGFSFAADTATFLSPSPACPD